MENYSHIYYYLHCKKVIRGRMVVNKVNKKQACSDVNFDESMNKTTILKEIYRFYV